MQALFDLAGRPQYIIPLRQELERVIAENGGSRELTPRSLSKLVNMDSFLKESQRHVSQNLREWPLHIDKTPLRIAKGITPYSLTQRALSPSIHIPKSHIPSHPQRRYHPPNRHLRMRTVHGPGGRPANPHPFLRRLPLGQATARDRPRHQIPQCNNRVSHPAALHKFTFSLLVQRPHSTSIQQVEITHPSPFKKKRENKRSKLKITNEIVPTPSNSGTARTPVPAASSPQTSSRAPSSPCS